MNSPAVDEDVAHALVPHTLKAPMPGLGSGPLAGRSFMVKDLFAIAGQKVSNGNPAFYEQAEPALATAPAIQRLLDAGASLTGITICDEFFYSVLGTNVHYGTPINPRAPEHVTGGSSCGSAAAVAAGMCDFALGSDTGGSIRVPASYCGLYGLRPSHGRIDMTGVTPMAPSYDTVGMLAGGAELLRAVANVLLAGESVPGAVTRVLVAMDIFAHSEASMDEALWQVLDKLKPHLPVMENREIVGDERADWREAFRILQAFEIQSTLLPFVEAHKESVSPAIRERFEMAAKVTALEAQGAQSVRAEATRRLDEIVRPGTVIALPTTPEFPPERVIPDGASSSEFRRNTLASTCLAGHAGLPQISIPAAEASGCPVGLSFIGWRGGDEALLDFAVTLAPHLRA